MADNANIDRVTMIVLRSMRGPIFILITVYAVGIAGFALIPGVSGSPMSFLHATYFLSYTATTTGFGEIPEPFSEAQRLWAIVLLHVSVVAWLYSIGAIIQLVQNRHFQQALARYRFSRNVAQLDEPFVIISGFGDAGSLLARSLDDQSMSAVIIDNDPDRIKALSLRNFLMTMLGVCADSSDPQLLIDAGLQHRFCRGIVAVTDDDDVNLKTAIMTRVLSPELRPICSLNSPGCEEELAEVSSVLVLDSFEVFADRLSVALRRPALHALGDWLVRMPGASLDYRMNCPIGRWIICGYGRMGQRLEENLREQGIDVVIIDPDIPEEQISEQYLRGSANRTLLKQARIDEATCVIVATDSDTANIRIMIAARDLNADVFIVLRQNNYYNEIVFEAAEVDMVMHPDRVISRRIQLELLSPRLQPLLDHLQGCPVETLEALFDRLRAAMGRDMPVLWTNTLDEAGAPALAAAIANPHGIRPSLRDVMRCPPDREQLIDCVPLILERGGEERRIPELDTELESGDAVLFCGTRASRTAVDAVLHNPYTLGFLASGDEQPRGYLAHYLKTRLQSTTRQV